MGLFKFLRKPVLDDPDFGRIQFLKPSLWEGECDFDPGGYRVHLFIPGTREGPSPDNRAAWHELGNRYRGDLQTAIGGELFELYKNYRSDFEGGEPPPELPDASSPEDIWSWCRLEGIAVLAPGKFELTYSFDWHEQHMFAAQIVEWEFVGIAVDDA